MSTPIAQPAPSPVPAHRGLVVCKWGILVIAAVLALGLFVQRGVMRGIEGSWDFTMVYAGAHQLVQGGDPYDFESTYDAFAAAGGTGRPRDPMWFQTLYPPFTYAVLSPLGLLSWQQAKLIWLTLNLISTAAVAIWLVRHSPTNHPLTPGPRPPFRMTYGTYWALVLWFGSAVLHTTLAFGQLSLITLALMLPVLGPEKFTPDGRPEIPPPWLSARALIPGMSLALAGALKPQLVGLIALMLLVTPRFRIVLWALGLGLVLFISSAFWLSYTTPEWLAHWQQQLTNFTASGMADPTAANPYTFQMINLEPWLHRVFVAGNRGIIGIFAITLPACLFVFTVIHLNTCHATTYRNQDSKLMMQNQCHALGLAVTITLLIAYHRTYDAVLLVIPAIWAWQQFACHPRDPAARLTLMGTSFFLLPGPVILATLTKHHHVPQFLSDTWLWQAVLLPHHNLALLLIAAALSLRIFNTFGHRQSRKKTSDE